MSLRFRLEQVLVACSLSLLGLSVGALILLRDPMSFLSRWLDGQVGEAVELPAPPRGRAS